MKDTTRGKPGKSGEKKQLETLGTAGMDPIIVVSSASVFISYIVWFYSAFLLLIRSSPVLAIPYSFFYDSSLLLSSLLRFLLLSLFFYSRFPYCSRSDQSHLHLMPMRPSFGSTSVAGPSLLTRIICLVETKMN